METINYEPLIQQKPPEDIISWVLSQGAMDQEFLIYKAGREYVPLEDRCRPAVEVICTACGKHFVADKVQAGGCSHGYARAPFGFLHPVTMEQLISGNDSLCPICGAQARVRHVGQIQKGGIDDWTFITTIHRIPVEGKRDRLVLQEWKAGCITQKDGSRSFYTVPWTAWVVEETKIVRMKAYTRYFSALQYHGMEQRKSFLDDYGESYLVYPWDPALLEGTTAENSKLDRYIAQGGTRLVAYLAMWRRKPAAENLVMQGYGRLVDQLIDKEQHTGTYERKKGIPKLQIIDWKEKRPNRMLRMSKAEFRQFSDYMTVEKFEMLTWARQSDLDVQLPDDLDTLDKLGRYVAQELFGLTGQADFWKAVQYMKRQGADFTTLRDYWAMATALKMDLENAQVRWPKNLKAAHDKAAKRQQEEKDAVLKKKFEKRLAELEAYSWASGNILIRPVATEAELRREGKILCHCVGSYAKKHAEGGTAIFLIRRADAPADPWYTLELDENELAVRQNRGKHNCDRTEEIQAFENAWLEWLRTAIKKKTHRKKGVTAA